MACARLGDTEVEDDLHHAEIIKSRPATPMQRTELSLENMLSKMTDLAKSQTELVKYQNDMETRLSQQQTVLAKETASELQSLHVARDTATSLERLEEGQGQLAFTQAHQTAEVSEIVHRLNDLEMSRSNSRMSNRSISPTTNPYLEGSTLKVPGYSAGALVPPATLVNPSFNVISTVESLPFPPL